MFPNSDDANGFLIDDSFCPNFTEIEGFTENAGYMPENNAKLGIGYRQESQVNPFMHPYSANIYELPLWTSLNFEGKCFEKPLNIYRFLLELLQNYNISCQPSRST